MESTTQIYLEITPESGSLLGESMAGGYETRIDIEGFDLTIGAKSKTVKDLEKRDAAGNLDFSRISISKVFDRASLPLARMLSGHAKFSEAKIAVDQQFVETSWGGKVRNEVLTIHLKSGYVADIKLRTTEGKTGASIKEDIELSFHNFSINYYAYKGDPKTGEIGDDYRMGWSDFQTHRDEQQG
jgi:type VI protein secretion system component Hcp